MFLKHATGVRGVLFTCDLLLMLGGVALTGLWCGYGRWFGVGLGLGCAAPPEYWLDVVAPQS